MTVPAEREPQTGHRAVRMERPWLRSAGDFDVNVAAGESPGRFARAKARLRCIAAEYAPALGLYAASRAAVFVAAMASLAVQRRVASGPWPRIDGPHVGLLQVFARWDGAWYLDIARHGYRRAAFPQGRNASTAFFPGYPAVVRVISWLTHSPAIVTGLFLNVVLGAIVAGLAWRLVADLVGRDAAKRAVAILCFAPGAFVLSMTYSEPLFLVFVLMTLLLLLRQRYAIAGVVAAAASCTRPNGVALAGTCVVVAVAVYAEARDRRAMVAALLAPVGIVSYFAYLWRHTGSAGMWFTAERQGWSDRVAPIASIVVHVERLIGQVPSLHLGGFDAVAWAVGSLTAVAGVVLLLRWRPPLPVLAYGLFAIAFAASSYQIGLTPRMLMVAFPALLAIGVMLRGPTFRAVLATSAALLVVSTYLTFATQALVP